MATKRQTTLAKLNRERAVREKRARKQEKKEERKARGAEGAETIEGGEVVDGEAVDAAPGEAAADPEV
jgi:hypothetical protein